MVFWAIKSADCIALFLYLSTIINMKIIIKNNKTLILEATQYLSNVIEEELSYVDKSKQYQLKRLSKTAWGRSSPDYKKLQNEVNGRLFKKNNNDYIINSSFFDFLVEKCPNEFVNVEIQDNRKETGHTIVVPWVVKPFDLRPYQEEAVDKMMNNYRGVINMATGLGKTLIATHFIKRYKKNALVICPSDSVAQQFYEQFVKCFGKNKVGFYGGGKKKILDITVSIAASATRNIEELKKQNFGVIIFDEVHHTPASTFFEIAEGLSDAGKIFGLTATDYRSDGKDIMITAGCGNVLLRRDIKWGVTNGFLAEPFFIVKEIETGGKDYKDDKLKSYKEHVLNNQIMKSRIESDAREAMANGQAVLILVDEVAHGRELSERLNIPFATGEDKNSQEYINQLNDNKINGLVGTDGKIGEGSDTKNVDVLILANFVASKGQVVQCVGRALRRQGSKTKALIIDYKPLGSTMLSRHADNRIKYYLEMTDNVKKDKKLN
jgi:superfamily II DNA or RNA helicase